MRPDQIQTTAMPPTLCPACGEALAAITGTGTPEPGVITLCAYCRVFLIVTDTLSPRVLSNREWTDLSLERRETLTRMRDWLQALR